MDFNIQGLNGRTAKVAITFFSAKPYCESIGTTMDAETFNAVNENTGLKQERVRVRGLLT